MPSKKNQNLFDQCPCVGATLDKLVQPAMLAILAKGTLHGYELAKKIGEIPHFLDEAPDVSGVYRMLKSLEARGMVTSEWEIGSSATRNSGSSATRNSGSNATRNSSQGGRPKRLFTITDAGLQCLAHWNQTLQSYHKAIGSLLKATQKAVR